MQQDFAELTIAAVNGLYGELSSQIYASLAYTGRRTLQEIVRHTHFSSKQVGATLVVLIQHQLVQHHTTEQGQTFYEANGNTAYNVVFRYEKLVKAVEESLGDEAVSVIRQVALLGHATPARLQSTLGLNKTVKKIAAPVNGKKRKSDSLAVELEVSGELAPNPKISSVKELHDVLKQLLELGFLSLVTRQQFTPLRDLTTEAEGIVKRESFPKGLITAKEKQAFPLMVENLKRKWRDDANSYMTSKRLKLETIVNGPNGASGGLQLKDDMVVKLNFEKCSVILRNLQLTNYAHRYLGETTSKVFRAVLHALESHVTRCFDPLGDVEWDDNEPTKTPCPSLQSILRYIPEDVDLSDGLPETAQNNVVNGHTPSAPVAISSSSDSDSDSDIGTNHQPAQKKQLKRGADAIFLVEKHLRLLERDPRGFVKQVDNNGWSVPFRQLTRSMIQYEIENTIAAQYGQLAARIIRILQRNLSNDEKGLAIAAVIKPKDVRSLTNTLLAAGMIETQEIPRDTNRTTNRLLWLYAYTPEKARKQITVDSYRAMSRFLRRLEIEKTEYSASIDKSERTDVIGHEDQYLNEKDKEMLDRWNKKEQVILGQISRIDDLVACMRDFAPLDDPYIGYKQLDLEEDD